MRAPALLLALALVATALAGCLATKDDAPPPATDVPADGGAPRAVALYLTGDKGITDVAPVKEEADRVASGSFFKAWAAGSGLPTWRGAPLAQGLNITGNITVTFYVTADKVVGPSMFSSYVVYFGEGDNLLALAGVPSEKVIRPGQVVEVKGTLESPRGGLLLPAGSSPTALLAPVQTQDAPADLYFLVNGTQHASRIEFEATPTSYAPPTEEVSRDTQSGTTLGSAYYLGVREGLNTLSIPIDATGAEVLEITLQVKGNAGIPDVDMTLYDAAGDFVGTGSTPYPRETIRLYPQNLQGETAFTLHVTSYGSVQASFDVTIAKYAPAA